MITIAFIMFVRKVWLDADVIAAVNFTLIAMVMDSWLAVEVMT